MERKTTNLYVLTFGVFVRAVGRNLSEVRAQGLESLRHADIIEHKWETDQFGDDDRAVLKYRPKRSGRWNVSSIVVTTMTLEEN